MPHAIPMQIQCILVQMSSNSYCSNTSYSVFSWRLHIFYCPFPQSYISLPTSYRKSQVEFFSCSSIIPFLQKIQEYPRRFAWIDYQLLRWILFRAIHINLDWTRYIASGIYYRTGPIFLLLSGMRIKHQLAPTWTREVIRRVIIGESQRSSELQTVKSRAGRNFIQETIAIIRVKYAGLLRCYALSTGKYLPKFRRKWSLPKLR
jgi:hypothetical protein